MRCRGDRAGKDVSVRREKRRRTECLAIPPFTLPHPSYHPKSSATAASGDDEGLRNDDGATASLQTGPRQRPARMRRDAGDAACRLTKETLADMIPLRVTRWQVQGRGERGVRCG